MLNRIFVSETINKVGETVKVAGWVHSRRDHGKIIFIDLRDRTGLLQIVCAAQNNKELYDTADTLRSEWVVEIEGVVKARPEKMVNPRIVTGKVELEARHLKILNESKTPPFEISGLKEEVHEDVRMKYRYLDLRRKNMKDNIVLRSRVTKFMRDFLIERHFIEIETPILTKSTPEGARDFIVPSRLQSGKFYALPQSPQQYKQLLMVAGMERYFQIARCFRDEDTRGDRQAEFTQLDIEMSFIEQEDIIQLLEELYIAIVKTLTPEKNISRVPFPRLTYKETMEQYGSDKPDLRKNKSDPNELAFAWIVDFPMFEWKKIENRWDAVHHPFTKIKNEKLKIKNDDEFIDFIKHSPAELLAHQYDLVLNGYEIGGGSIREHNPRILEAVFEIMGHTKDEIQQKFGHLLEAFEYGVPPHGGIAPGLDRFVMILANEPNIREVIAFPKTGDGRDLMMGAPASVESKQLKELHLNIERKEQ